MILNAEMQTVGTRQ